MEDPKLLGVNLLEEAELPNLGAVVACGVAENSAIALVPAFPACTWLLLWSR